MAEPYDTWITERLSMDEVAILRQTFVEMTVDHSLDLVALASAWRQHVERIERELSFSMSEPSAWGMYDLIAALHLRDFLKSGISRLPAGLRDRISALTGEVDHRFFEYTELDGRGLVARIDNHTDRTRDWWWQRIPKSGPVREEILVANGLPLD